MPNPTTPNLGLNKIDRTSPETTYFDLNKYIDQNAEKVDSFAGDVQEEISALKDRLDHAVTKEITLNPGLQVVNSPKDSRFKLSEIQGRTLINLLGVSGECDNSTLWINTGSIQLDTSQKTSGSTSFKVTIPAESGSISRHMGTVPGKKYVLIADVKNEDTTHAFVSVTGVSNGNLVTDNTFAPSVLRFTATQNDHIIAVVGSGSSGKMFYVDSVRLYEVSQTEYDAIADMTPEQVAERYPFVPSGIIGVENPYVFGYGENLLPPFYEWQLLNGETSIISPYELKLTPTGTGRSSYRDVPAVVGETYTFTGYRKGRYKIEAIDQNGSILQTLYNDADNAEGELTAIVVAPNETKFLRIVVLNGALEGGPFTFKNPMLVVGNEAKPFKPQRKSMLALQTELHANPVDGSDPDILFEKEGQYSKLAKWKRFSLDGGLTYAASPKTGYKQVVFPFVSPKGLGGTENSDKIVVTKYDGKKLSVDATASVADTCYLNSAGTSAQVTVSNYDSGWGDNYTPTADEVKAYFMGWKMMKQGTTWTSPYDGTGEKGWCKIYSGVGTNTVHGVVSGSGTTTVPTVMNDMGYTPYQLLYRLAKEVVEPVPFEGALVLPEGQSVVEVGTGIVVREKVNPVVWSSNNLAYINSGNEDGDVTKWSKSRLSNKVAEILRIFKNGIDDTENWDILTTNASAGAYGYGVQYARSTVGSYDPSAIYTVTYIKLDKSPIQPIKGVVANNEKAQIRDLVDAAAAIIGTIPIKTKGGAGSEESENGAIRTVIPYTTTKSGDAYTISTSDVLVANQQITVKFNANSSGTPTLKFGSAAAYPIKKANGSAASFYASVYTLFFDGSAFILSGEGGEVESYGTATASDVLASKTILTGSGLVAGTMINRGVVNQTITSQNGQYTIPQGYHNGSGKVTATFENLVAGNVKSGVNIGGVVGTLIPSVSGSSVVNFDAESPFPANSVKLYPLLTLPAGIKFGTFLTSSNTIFRDTDTAYGYIRFRDTVTGQVFDNRMLLNQFTVKIIRITFDFATEYPNTSVLIETNSQSPYIKSNIIGLKTTNPIELIGYVENKNSYDYYTDLFRIHGTFNYA
ncbi:hypothetical protein [Paenibacillus barengoltzii]|uniref:hypothetical protein n=1 Tax=Paenibacillus barengoltzii TaxID=343517 RepID=UPI002FDA59E0